MFPSNKFNSCFKILLSQHVIVTMALEREHGIPEAKLSISGPFLRKFPKQIRPEVLHSRLDSVFKKKLKN